MTWYANSEGRHGASGRKGDLGEKLVEEYFLHNSITYEHKTDIESQVHKKIDFSVGDRTIDVKNNVFKGWHCVEVGKKNGSPGWLFTSSADSIYAVDYENKNIYSYDLLEMRNYINVVRWEKKSAKITKNGDQVIWVNVKEPFFTKLQ